MFFVKKLEEDFGKDIEDLKQAEDFWRKLKMKYVPETLLKDHGYTSVETCGEDSIQIKGKRYVFYGYAIVDNKEKLMVVYEMEEAHS